MNTSKNSNQLQDKSSDPALDDICGDLNMRIDAQGTWYHEGSPIGRMELVKLFASVLKRDADGIFWLQTPVERGRIQVDDAPFVAVELAHHGDGPGQTLKLRTNLDEWVTLGEDHPLRVEIHAETGEPRPYVLVRGRLEALIARSVFYEMVNLGVEEKGKGAHILGVWSQSTFFPLGEVTETP